MTKKDSVIVMLLLLKQLHEIFPSKPPRCGNSVILQRCKNDALMHPEGLKGQ